MDKNDASITIPSIDNDASNMITSIINASIMITSIMIHDDASNMNTSIMVLLLLL